MLAVRIVLIIATAFLGVLSWQLKGWKRTGSWIILVAIIGLQLYQLYQDTRKEHATARSGKIEAPPTASPVLSLYYGSNLFVTASKTLTDDILDHFIHPWPKMNTFIRRDNERLIVDIDVRNNKNEVVARIKNNEWAISDAAFDRNYDNDKFEVFDKYEEIPVLQIMFVKGVVVLNGIFYGPDGMKQIAVADGLFINPTKPIKLLGSPWFKYPSGEHPGELNKESVDHTVKALKQIQQRHPQ